MSAPRRKPADARALYLDLMKRCLSNLVYEDPGRQNGETRPFDEAARRLGLDWPTLAHSMIGWPRLENIQRCVEDVLEGGVPGDLVEAGVWRGGATIFMRAILKAHDVADRRVWVADSFEGLPPPDAASYPADSGDRHHTVRELRVSLAEVQRNFAKYDLLDEHVRFLKGWFRDSLPAAPIGALAVIRLDADMYGSTIEALTYLYPKLSRGGYVIVDDYGAVPACRRAVDDYRARHSIREEMRAIDWTGVYWRRG